MNEIFGATPDASFAPQAIRVLDVVVIGPLMIAGAVSATSMPTVARAALGAFGVTAILYNGVNFVRAAARPGLPRFPA